MEMAAVAPEAEVAALRSQLEELRDPHKALQWSLAGKLPERTIEKLMRLVELELEYQGNPKEG
jgi:hypothetical protein